MNVRPMLPTSCLPIPQEKPNSIIGGLFGLEWALLPQGLTPPFLTGRDVFLVNARSGIWLLLNRLRPSQVCVPSFLCPTILGVIDPNITVLRYSLRVK